MQPDNRALFSSKAPFPPPARCVHHVLLQEVEARQPSTVLFAPPTSLPRVVCVMNQIHWG